MSNSVPANFAALAAAICVLLGHRASALEGLVAHRPPATSWKRTQCGSPTSTADIPTKWGQQVSADEPPLQLFPRPQLVRGVGRSSELRDHGDPSTWGSLNGLWEWEPASSKTPPFGRTLSKAILVPFPVESCLSGVAPRRTEDVVTEMLYRLVFDLPPGPGRLLLHFGAVDWQATVYLNGQQLGRHSGGYDGFSFDITDVLRAEGNELMLLVYDPSEHGMQPHGKQRASAISTPGAAAYTPSSGIWQTVWLERVPQQYIDTLQIGQASLTTATVKVAVAGAGELPVTVTVYDPDTGAEVAQAAGRPGEAIAVRVPSPRLWSKDSPTLYDLRVRFGEDEVLSYFGLRTYQLADVHGVKQPALNGKFTFLTGFLDQSWWPDGQYTAPCDEALRFDLEATVMFGFNLVRLHEKVNPERWYYHADRLGIAVFQDMPQKYGGAGVDLQPVFHQELEAMIRGRGNHPCILQWAAFNEMDCWMAFPGSAFGDVISLIKKLDPDRLVDADSGGWANAWRVGDVNDIHTYPSPGDTDPSSTQYAMLGEFGGLGVTIPGTEWAPGRCFAYRQFSRSSDQVSEFSGMCRAIQSRVGHISASVYTQTTDVEFECDGFLTYDRRNKFSPSETMALRKANEAIIQASALKQAMQSIRHPLLKRVH